MSELEELLAAAGPAHHQAFIETDGEDPEWPLWYAEHLQDDLSAVLGASLTKSRLTYLLIDMEEKRAGHAPDSPWPSFYAAELERRRADGTLT